MTTAIKDNVKRGVMDGRVKVMTDPRASPTGYPFKVVEIAGENSRNEGRTRCCDLGYLRTAYREESGRLGYRCAAEPIDTYVKRGGTVEETEGRKCLCNGLFANIGLGQARPEGVDEQPLLTSGDDLACLGAFFRARPDYTASDVVDHLLHGCSEALLNGRGIHASANGAGSNGHSANGNGVGHGLNGSEVHEPNRNGTNGVVPHVATVSKA
jgi:hypothetical protein